MTIALSDHPRLRSSIRTGLLVLLLVVGLAGVGEHGRAQDVATLRQKAVRGVAGPDGRGTDGPLQAVGFSLALLHRLREAPTLSSKATQAIRQSLPPSLRTEGDWVTIDALARDDAAALRRDLEALGLANAAVAGRIVSGRLPIDAIDEMAALSTLHSAWPLLAVQHVGATTSQGVRAMGIDTFRTEHGVDGSGIQVGVLSDSYNNDDSQQTGAQEDIASGDLPDGIDVLDDADEPQTDEGRALLQIVHDVAPGAELAFHTAFDGLANFLQGIQELADRGADVIIDDIIFLSEPMFQDGLLAQTVDEAVFGEDVVYVSSAGNSGRDAYAQRFRGTGEIGPLGGELHDYEVGPGVDTAQEVVVERGAELQIAFHWDQPSASAGGPGARTDMEIAIRDKRGRVLSAERRDNIGGNPFDFAALTNSGDVDADNDGVADTTFQVSVERIEGPPPQRIHYVLFTRDGNVELTEFHTRSPSLYGHSNARGALSTAAAAFFNTPVFGTEPPLVNSFSSVGGIRIRFDNLGRRLASPEARVSPDLTAPDGGNTTFFGQRIQDEDLFPNFFGTSAAAAHAAGVAALVREALPNATADEVVDRMRQSAIDIEQTASGVETGTGPDAWSGTGLVDASRISVRPPVIASFSAQTGDDRSPVVTWTEADASTVESYTLERSFLGGSFQSVETVTGGQGQYSVTVSELPVGAHDFRLQIHHAGGTTERGPRARATIPASSAVSVRGPFPNPTQDQFTLEVTLDEEQGVLMLLYDVLGRQLSVEFQDVIRSDRPRRVRIDVPSRYGSGLYFVRIVGEQFDTAVPVQVVR